MWNKESHPSSCEWFTAVCSGGIGQGYMKYHGNPAVWHKSYATTRQRPTRKENNYKLKQQQQQ